MAETHVSQAEKHFIINNAYKRGRRYFDIVRLNQMERQQEMQRRMPAVTKETIESRVGESFISSDELLHDKVANDLQFFHRKQLNDEADEIQTTYTARTAKAKTVDMRKMLARSDLEKSKLLYRNEEQFNNYYETHSRPRMSLDFQKSVGRRKSSIRYLDDPEEPSGEKVSKVYQKLLFDQGNFSCLVDYKKNGKFVPKPKVDESPAYEPKKVQRGEALTKRNLFAQELQFYSGNGKAEPSQMDNRILKQNEYFWRGVRQDREKLKDFAANKRKEDQERRRIDEILGRHKCVDNRQEMCDQKYFNRNS